VEGTIYSFGYWIQRRRKSFDLTRGELATRVQCSISTIKKIERDERRPSHQIAELLANALSVPPEEQRLFVKVARGNLSVDRLQTAAKLDHSPTRILHNLSPQPTAFIGRETELAEITARLVNPNCQLLTLVGPGGIGKSRLAMKVAEDLVTAFPDGVYLISLAKVDSVDLLPARILADLDVELYDKLEPRQQLFSYLKNRKILLVLDNFENLLEGVGLLTNLLHNCSYVTLLVTSRERLNLKSEWVYPVEGLRFPPKGSEKGIEKYSAVSLFLQTAHRVRADFELADNNLAAVARICRLVEGMPLAIELAATWLPVLEPPEIATEIEKGMDILESGLLDLPERQRSIRAVFNASWQLLMEEEQEAMQRLSVFRGGFTLSVLEHTVRSPLRVILSLVNKCWIRPEVNDRFHFHELSRLYAFERLQSDRDLFRSATENHSAYFCNLLEECEIDWGTNRHVEAISEIEAEIQNIEQAWKWLLDHGRLDLMKAALESLIQYYGHSGRQMDGIATCREAVELLETIPSTEGFDSREASILKARALFFQGRFSDKYSTAITLYQEAEAILDQLEQVGQEVRPVRARLLFGWGSHASWSDSEEAQKLLNKSLTLYEELGDESKRAGIIDVLGMSAWISGDIDRAMNLSQESLEISKRLGHTRGIADSLNRLGKVYRETGQLEEAERSQQESLVLTRQIGPRIAEGGNLLDLAHTLLCAGKFIEAIEKVQDSINIFELHGRPQSYAYYILSRALMHTGDLDQARAWATRSLETGRDYIDDLITLTLNGIGEIDLVEKQLSQAQVWFNKSLDAALERNQKILVDFPIANLAYWAIMMEQPGQAREYLSKCLEHVAKMGSFRMAVHALPCIALLEADQGNIERSVELYALASRYGYIANSKWFDNLVGQQIKAMASSLPVEAREAAEERGRSLDFWEVIRIGRGRRAFLHAHG
jgi:tetratricopeptide (TPR) repeat protein/transcriptional regulator with XRE-family HTH domain